MSNRPSNWTSIAQEVYERDDYTCQNCGRRGGSGGGVELHAHHGVPLNKGGTSELSNLITYCKDCHQAIHGNQDAPTAAEDSSQTDPVEAPFPNAFLDCPNCGNVSVYDTSITMYKIDPEEPNTSSSSDGLAVHCSECGMVLEGVSFSTWKMVEGNQELVGTKLARQYWRQISEDVRAGVSIAEAKANAKKNDRRDMAVKLLLLFGPITIFILYVTM